MDRTRLVAALRVAFDQQDSTATHAGILDADTLGGEFEVPVTISLEPGQHDVTLLCSGQGAVMMYSEPWEQEFFYNPEPAEQAAGPEFPGSGTVATASFAALGEEGVPAEIDSCGDGIARATHRVTVERGDDTTLWFSSLDDGEVTVAYTVQPVDGPANAEAVTATATQLREVRAALAPWPATGQAHRAVVSLAPPQEGKDHRMVVLEAPAYSERMSVTVHCMGEAWMDIARQESSGDLDTVEPLGARECYPDRVRSRPHELISHAEVGMAVYLVGPATGEEPLAVSYAVDGPVQ